MKNKMNYKPMTHLKKKLSNLSEGLGLSSFLAFTKNVGADLLNTREVLQYLQIDSRENRSIASKAKQAIFYFPVIISNSVDPKVISKLVVALEAEYMTFIRLATGLEGVVKMDKNSVANFIKSLHRNVEATTYSIGDYVRENADVEIKLEDKKLFEEGMSYVEEKYGLSDLLDEAAGDRREFRNGNRQRKDPPENNSEERRPSQNREPIYEYSFNQVSTEIKKNNDLEPSLFQVSIKAVDSNNDKEGNYKVTIGVKCVAHSVTSDEMVDNLMKCVYNDSFLFRFIRWTTGEFAFWRDFVFNFKELRENAIKTGKGKRNPWFDTLKNRGSVSAFHGAGYNAFPPNATFVISNDEYEYIKSKSGIDLMGKDINKLKFIMQKFFLMTFVIVDSNRDMIHILFDSDTQFTHYSTDRLERHTKDNLKELKELFLLTTSRPR